MKKTIFLFLLTCMLTSCSFYQPIVHTNKYYAPVSFAIFVDQAPAGSVYIGTVKIVPHDNSNPFADDIEKAKRKMLEAAAEAGARYVVITNYQKPTSDYKVRVDLQFGDGINLTGEMFR